VQLYKYVELKLQISKHHRSSHCANSTQTTAHARTHTLAFKENILCQIHLFIPAVTMTSRAFLEILVRIEIIRLQPDLNLLISRSCLTLSRLSEWRDGQLEDLAQMCWSQQMGG